MGFLFVCNWIELNGLFLSNTICIYSQNNMENCNGNEKLRLNKFPGGFIIIQSVCKHFLFTKCDKIGMQIRPLSVFLRLANGWVLNGIILANGIMKYWILYWMGHANINNLLHIQLLDHESVVLLVIDYNSYYLWFRRSWNTVQRDQNKLQMYSQVNWVLAN